MAQKDIDARKKARKESVAASGAKTPAEKKLARQKFYVNTRMAELAAKGITGDRKALRQKFQSGDVKRAGFAAPKKKVTGGAAVDPRSMQVGGFGKSAASTAKVVDPRSKQVGGFGKSVASTAKNTTSSSSGGAGNKSNLAPKGESTKYKHQGYDIGNLGIKGKNLSDIHEFYDRNSGKVNLGFGALTLAALLRRGGLGVGGSRPMPTPTRLAIGPGTKALTTGTKALTTGTKALTTGKPGGMPSVSGKPGGGYKGSSATDIQTSLQAAIKIANKRK